MAYKDNEKELEYQKTYYERNKEKKKQYHKNYYESNKERLLNRQKIWKESNKERLKEYRRNYYENNKEKELENQRIWKEANWKQTLEQTNKYRKKRYAIDPNFKLTISLRSRFYYELKKHSATKKQSSITLVGCSIKKLKKYLESKFEEGMTWDNWSTNGWHVDHIVPCSSFDLTKEKEQKKCFHYTNLQPLWAVDNRAKQSKLDWVKECA